MADVTVKQLAQTIGVSAERLLGQLKDAGLVFSNAEQMVTEEQKRLLLAHLKRSHGDDKTEVTPHRITLKRKSISQVKLGGAGAHDAHRGKTVNIEVRKKRTYVKQALTSAPEVIEETPAPAPVVESLLEEPIVENIVEAVVEEQADNTVITPELEIEKEENAPILTEASITEIKQEPAQTQAAVDDSNNKKKAKTKHNGKPHGQRSEGDTEKEADSEE